MKIINEQGMVGFGKYRINIIDLLVCIFLLSLTPMFWFGYKLSTKKPPVPVPIIKTWERSQDCQYCKFSMSKSIPWGQSPEEKAAEITCSRCGKKQMINFGFDKKIDKRK